MEHEKTLKEKFLEVKNYEEFEARREEFNGLRLDKEVLDHTAKIFPSEYFATDKRIAWDVKIGDD